MSERSDAFGGGFDVVAKYQQLLDNDEDITMPIAAIEALVALLSHLEGTTISEFMDKIQRGIATLKSNVDNSVAVAAGCDLFMKYVTRTLSTDHNLERCKEHLIENGQLLVERAKAARERIADAGASFIRPDMTILTHGFSRSVLAVCVRAARQNKRFRVFLTESRPSGSGTLLFRRLQREGIPCCLILDAAIGSIIEEVDLVVVGAEGIVENGGIINQIGTFSLGVIAKAAHKRLIVVAESHKFVRLFPLSQRDLPCHRPELVFSNGERSAISSENETSESEHRNGLARVEPQRPNLFAVSNKRLMNEQQIRNNPFIDFTPPEYIHALITDLGIVDPMSGVSEELIRLHF